MIDLQIFADKNSLASIGVADLERVRHDYSEALKTISEKYTRAIVFGIRLEDTVIDSIKDRPTPLYFHLYRQANFALDRAGYKLALNLQYNGYKALAVPASQIVDRTGKRGMVSHKLLGYYSGIGWIGRSTLLVNEQFGARMRYSTVLTNSPYKTAEPINNQCGQCLACVTVCPANAIQESSYDFAVDVCYEKLTEFLKIPFIGQHVCGICVKACRGPQCV